MRNNRVNLRCLAFAASTIALALAPSHASASEQSVSLRDSFPIGSNGLCEAQIMAPEVGAGLFDRRYSVICRDASAPIGTLWVTRDGAQDDSLTAYVPEGEQCQSAQSEGVAMIDDLDARLCSPAGGGIQRQVLFGRSGSKVYAAQGLAVYDDALRLGLETLATDRLVDGEVDIPLTEAGDARAFARAQAEAISADAALAEAYRRSNAGNFAEAAEFFATSAADLSGNSATEALLNRALQQSNLGNYYEAIRLFGEAQPAAAGDPVLARMLRNFEAIDALNRRSYAEALETIDRPLPRTSSSLDALRQLEIDPMLSERLTAEQGNMLSGVGGSLTPLERAQLLDGQADYIRATALRLGGNPAASEASLIQAREALQSVRGGRVGSILWMRAQLLAELAEIEERRGNLAGAETYHGEAIALLEANYPGSPALVSARAQLAGLYARSGRSDEAIALYRDMVAKAEGKPASSLRRLLAPYFRLLVAQPGNGQAAADMFAASQLLLRPGLAQTQAVLARELSGGSDEASQLFRQSLNLSRGVEKLRAEVAQMESRLEELPQLAANLEEKRIQLGQMQERQLDTQQKLAEYPRYRVVSDSRMDLSDLQGALRDGEAYLKLVMLENATYAIHATGGDAVAYAVDGSPDEISAIVDNLRASIAIDEGGQTVTYPFDIETARDLYVRLFGPVDARMQGVTHLVFEPDGALLRLPANLLVMDDASVARYVERVADPDGDPYDFRGTEWLGRKMQVTTAVAASSFRDVRAARPSNASGEYIGFGENTPLGDDPTALSGTRAGVALANSCSWAPATWNDPIAADELRTASAVFGMGPGSTLLTGDEFTDTHLRSMDNLDDFRIMHFATHGLVTAPRPQCPPRPALLTSFGDQDSDGLLTFAEIYDLKIDADLVILSACDTAGQASMAATREAGISSGGDFALDGLVRAFVGAGGRSVVASHWPVPDDFNATQRLITGLFQASPGVGSAEALRQSQLSLMEDADTSHPFYWSAFAIVGDGSVPVRRSR